MVVVVVLNHCFTSLFGTNGLLSDIVHSIVCFATHIFYIFDMWNKIEMSKKRPRNLTCSSSGSCCLYSLRLGSGYKPFLLQKCTLKVFVGVSKQNVCFTSLFGRYGYLYSKSGEEKTKLIKACSH